MATSSPSIFFFASTPNISSLSPNFLISPPKPDSLSSFKSLKLTVCCAPQTFSLETPEQTITDQTKKRRKPRPSFLQQIQHRWSVKPTSTRDKFPWQEAQKEKAIEHIGDVEEQRGLQVSASESNIEKKCSSVVDQSSSVVKSKVILPPWAHGKNPRNIKFNVQVENSQNLENSCDGNKKFDGLTEHHDDYVDSKFVRNSTVSFELLGKDENIDASANEGCQNSQGSIPKSNNAKISDVDWGIDNLNGYLEESEDLENQGNVGGRGEENQVVEVNEALNRVSKHNLLSAAKELGNVKDYSSGANSLKMPWNRESSDKSVEKGIWIRSNTELAEKLIPEPELKRLRNVALRMVERIKVGAAGVTQALVDSIHEKWKYDEVVKLKFEGPSASNMRRTHEFLESRTGGLVIWRSGSSVVLYRGLTYKFPCVQSYSKENHSSMSTSESPGYMSNDVTDSTGMRYSDGATKYETTDTRNYLKNLSDEELMDLSELDHLLDELGPRYKDWSGRDPLPVDADLLPGIIPAYKTPFRLLPHGVRHNLRDREMTNYRRMARTMPPHFALGRSRELQGLAVAMVKLWERCAIAKIAIKRGVQNTCNERMAEELKVLTGGTLLSRNKDYIVFYRGNDFLSPGVLETLVEAEKSAILHQDEEELIRQRATTFINSNAKAPKQPLVAGTLSETLAATSRWANQPSIEDLGKMMRDSAVSRQASLVKFLEMKLARAKEKIVKAEKALLKVQRNQKPAELPSDLETLSSEERFLYRKMGLSMKPFLCLGRRGVFGGTVENMHLHWKFRELVKIIVERKNFAQVKHIAIALEAESGGVLVSVDKMRNGHSIIIYRGKNYQPPGAFRPKNLLTKRQALARSIELQRREALKHHVLELQDKIQKLKSELNELKTFEGIDEATLYLRIDNSSDEDDDRSFNKDETNEIYLEGYDSDD